MSQHKNIIWEIATVDHCGRLWIQNSEGKKRRRKADKRGKRERERGEGEIERIRALEKGDLPFS